MKNKNLFLAVLAIVLVLCASIGAASAYFTTYADAKGGYVIQMKNQTEIREEVEGNVKTVTIANISGTDTETGLYPVLVRAKVFHGSDSNIDVPDTDDWKEKEADVYYYQSALYTGDVSTPLTINISVAKDANVQAGDNIDIIVTCESVPAVFNADGSPDLVTAWNNISAIHEISNG